MSEINPTCYVLIIEVFGKETIKHCDVDINRFLKTSKELIDGFISKSIFHNADTLKNINIRLYTY